MKFISFFLSSLTTLLMATTAYSQSKEKAKCFVHEGELRCPPEDDKSMDMQNQRNSGVVQFGSSTPWAMTPTPETNCDTCGLVQNDDIKHPQSSEEIVTETRETGDSSQTGKSGKRK